MGVRERDARGQFIGRSIARFATRADGYERWRAWDPVKKRDAYLFVHQLLACVDTDPADVFDPETEVHHIDGNPWHNVRENIELREHDEHADYHLHGRALQ